MRGMRILIRTDASVKIGSGHLMRCLTLADQLVGAGAEVAFVCRDLPGAMFDLLSMRGFRFAKLPSVEDGCVSQQRDAAETTEAIGQLYSDRLDWLIVDHYLLDASWEQLLRPCTRKIMVIDDLADRSHHCELLLDQNYESLERYSKLVSTHCSFLLGPKFALLRREYSEHRKSLKSRNRDARRVLVFFGGSDEQNITGVSFEALSQDGLRDLDVDVVIGANYQHRARLEDQVANRQKAIIHGPRPHLADLMAEADIAIGAGGVTNWERMCLGLPSLVVTLAENQVPISDILNNDGAIRLIGKAENVTAEDISSALLDEIGMGRYLSRGCVAREKCDGLGLNRVVDAIFARN